MLVSAFLYFVCVSSRGAMEACIPVMHLGPRRHVHLDSTFKWCFICYALPGRHQTARPLDGSSWAIAPFRYLRLLLALGSLDIPLTRVGYYIFILHFRWCTSINTLVLVYVYLPMYASMAWCYSDFVCLWRTWAPGCTSIWTALSNGISFAMPYLVAIRLLVRWTDLPGRFAPFQYLCLSLALGSLDIPSTPCRVLHIRISISLPVVY